MCIVRNWLTFYNLSTCILHCVLCNKLTDIVCFTSCVVGKTYWHCVYCRKLTNIMRIVKNLLITYDSSTKIWHHVTCSKLNYIVFIEQNWLTSYDLLTNIWQCVNRQKLTDIVCILEHWLTLYNLSTSILHCVLCRKLTDIVCTTLCVRCKQFWNHKNCRQTYDSVCNVENLLTS